MLVKWLRLPVACRRLCLRELAAEENWMLASKSVGYRRLLLLFFFLYGFPGFYLLVITSAITLSIT